MRNSATVFLLLVLSIAVYVTATLLLTYFGYIYTSNNLEISLVITAMFAVGAAMAFGIFGRLRREAGAVERMENAVINNTDDLGYHAGNLPGGWMKTRIERLAALNSMNADINDGKISGLLQAEAVTLGSMVRYIAGAAVFVGLLGTFLGIIQSAKGFDDAFRHSGGVTPYENVSAIIGGLDKALGTSIVGIIASLVLGFMMLPISNFKQYVLERLESVSMLKVLPFYKPDEANMLSERIAESIERVLPNVMRQAGNDLKDSSESLKAVTGGLRSVQSDFNDFTGKARDTVVLLEESTNNLRKSMQGESFAALNHSLAKLEGELAGNRRLLADLAAQNIKNAEVLENIGKRVAMSNQNLTDYIGVREKLLEQLLVELNYTLKQLQK